jgi:hypothetical protein
VKIDKKTVTVDGNEVMLMIWDLAVDDVMIPITMTEKLRRWLHAGKEKSPEAAQVCE